MYRNIIDKYIYNISKYKSIMPNAFIKSDMQINKNTKTINSYNLTTTKINPRCMLSNDIIKRNNSLSNSRCMLSNEVILKQKSVI
jgi:hypothetical protein